MLVIILAIAVAALAFFMTRGGGPEARATFLRRTALTFSAVITALIGLFVAGDTLADPGGWRAALLILLWLGPMAGLSLLAWFRPGWSVPVLAAAVAGIAAIAIWYAADPAGWRAFESQIGPVRALASFALGLPIALLAWRRPVTGGTMLIVLGLVPAVVSAGGPGFGASSLAAVSVPPVVAGLLYLAAEAVARRAAGRRAETDHGPAAGPPPGDAAGGPGRPDQPVRMDLRRRSGRRPRRGHAPATH